jgi:hypothetical protein
MKMISIGLMTSINDELSLAMLANKQLILKSLKLRQALIERPSGGSFRNR